MVELCRNEPNQHDVEKKLSGVLVIALDEHRRRTEHIPPVDGGAAAESSQIRSSMQFVCKMCDQMLFMMVEWARGARFFRELKVLLELLASSSPSQFCLSVCLSVFHTSDARLNGSR